MRIRTLFTACVMLLIQAGASRPARAQGAFTGSAADPYGLTAVNGAFRLKLGELSLDVQQGGMSQFQPFIYPLMSARGVELWGKDPSYRADHLFFMIRYGLFSEARDAAKIRDTDVPNLIGVSHTSDNVAEHIAQQEKFLTVRTALGPFSACARDTTLTEGGASVLVTSSAVWRRQGAMVQFATQVTHAAPTAGRTSRRPLLAATYNVVRSGYPLPSGSPAIPTRTDPGCSIERDELTALATPMDSTAFRALRNRLRGR